VNTPITVGPPIVNSIDPLNNTNINNNLKTITVTFDIPIKIGTSYNLITVTGPSGNISITTNINGNNLTITPKNKYADGKYTINIPINSITDLAGNNLNTTFTSFFTVDTISPTASANPTEGLYNTTKTVTLTISEQGTIYYTLNSTAPTTSSTIYSTPIQITSTTTVEYLAVDSTGNKSPIYTQIYTIDKTAPTASASLKSGVYTINKVVTLSMSKIGTIFYTINGSTPSTKSAKYIKPITVTSTTTLKFFAIDKAGNKSPIYTNKYIIEKAPKIISTTPNNQKTGFSRTEIITIKFNENIKKSTNWSKIQMKNLTQGKKVSITQKIKGNTLYIKMIFLRYTHNMYQITIPQAAIQDNTNNNLQKKYTFKFKTGK
jgi:methionine-rich copper-binding protein CopC